MSFQINDKCLIELNKVNWFSAITPLYAWGYKEVTLLKCLYNECVILFEDEGGKKQYYGICNLMDLRSETKNKRKFFRHLGLKFIKEDYYDTYSAQIESEEFCFAFIVEKALNINTAITWYTTIIISSTSDNCCGELEIRVPNNSSTSRKESVNTAIEALKGAHFEIYNQLIDCLPEDSFDV